MMNSFHQRCHSHAIDVRRASSAVVRAAEVLDDGQASHVLLTLAAFHFDFLGARLETFGADFRNATLALSNSHLQRRPPSGRVASLTLSRGRGWGWDARLVLTPDDSGIQRDHACDARTVFFFVVPGARGAQKIRFQGDKPPFVPSPADATAPSTELHARLKALVGVGDEFAPHWEIGATHTVAGRDVLLLSLS